MIAALLYFLIFAFLIYKNAFFGLFRDAVISKKQILILFIGKCIAVPVFYWIYEWKYGGVERFDAGLYLKDSEILYQLAFHNTVDFLKLFLGIGEIPSTSDSFTEFLGKTANWDDGVSYRLLFNDNRSVIRLHVLFHFFSFHHYFVHALFSCFIGFVGIFWIYKALRNFFTGKEWYFLLVFCYLPNTWLFSGALLKEPILFFNIGAILLLTNFLFSNNFNVLKKSGFIFLILILIVCLRPQVSFPLWVLYFLFRMVIHYRILYPAFAYVAACIALTTFGAMLFGSVKSISFFQYLNSKQTEFVEVMNGGYFLKDEVKFVYLPHRHDWIKEDSLNGEKRYRIVKDATFHYRLDRDQSIKHICKRNADTTTAYKLIYELIPAQSGFATDTLTLTFKDVATISKSMAYGLFLPLRFNSLVNSIVSLENLVLLFSFLLLLGLIYTRKQKVYLLFILLLTLFFIFLFGFTTPNTGAIVRYRSVIVPFLVSVIIYVSKRSHAPNTVS